MVPKLRLTSAQRISLVTMVIVLLTTPPSFAVQIDTKRSELNNVKAKIELSKKRKQATDTREAQIMREIEANDKKLSELTIEVQKLKVEVEKSTAKRKVAGEQLAETQKRLLVARDDLDVAERKLAYNQEIFSKRMRSIYKNGPSMTLTVLLGSKDIGELFERSYLVNRIAENDAKLVRQMKQLNDAVAEQVGTISEQKKLATKRHLFLLDEEAHLKTTKKKLCLKYDLFNSEQKRQKRMFASLEQEKIKLDQDIDSLTSSSNMIAEQIRMLERGGDIPSSGSFVKAGGAFMRPCDARITSGFGWRFHPVLHYRRLHAGIDFGAPSGSTIRAAQSGTVLIAGWMGGYGNAVVISHGSGTTTLYGHNSKLLVSAGDTVKQGQPVAKSGSTGLSTGPHLHFEVRLNGTPKNPMDWL